MEHSILEKILDSAIKKWASDIHISEDHEIYFRIAGELEWLHSSWILRNEHVKNILVELLGNNIDLYNTFCAKKDMDFAYIKEGGTPFRVNAYYKLWKISLVLRQIASISKSIDELWLPTWVKKFTKLKQGLILITWPTGSWKSTSMVAILEEINANRKEHIITIEDPVEYIFENKKSIISQREVGRDTESFTSALKSALREDPDIVVVWEMRDKETVSLALELSETWHLVFATLHTSGSVSTISRILSFFPSEIQDSVRYRLGDALFWVLSQRLVKKADGIGRVGIYELMIATSGIRNLIKNDDLTQVEAQIEMWSQEGMVLMEQYAERLYMKWEILKEDYINYFKDQV